MQKSLLDEIDCLVEKQGYASRSDFLRRIARKALVEEEHKTSDRSVIGTLTLLYEHENINIGHALNDLQHQFLDEVISSLHVHLDNANCLEILVLRGSSQQVRNLAKRMQSMRGIKLAKLVLARSCQKQGG